MLRPGPDEHHSGGGGSRSEPGADTYELHKSPGHLIRRAQQVHVELWSQLVGDGITSPQFAVLCNLFQHSPLDQTQLSTLAGLDTSTCQGVVSRLQRKGLINRTRDPGDGRRWLLTLTPIGSRALDDTLPAVVEVGERLLEPLTSDEATDLLRLLGKLAWDRTGDRAELGSHQAAGGND